MATTSFKQLLVHMDYRASMPNRLSAARKLAEQHGAAVCALYATTPALLAMPYAPAMENVLASELIALDEQRRSATLEAFEQAMTGSGAEATWAHTADMSAVESFSQQGRFADLMVLGQHESVNGTDRAVPADFVESVLAASGRPALVIPYTGWPGPIGERVVIAWKPTPEAARAVAGAMPVLERARRVHVLHWGAADEAARNDRTLDLSTYLKQHGISATWHAEGPEPSGLGELLLSRVCDLDADLLVMGCYGHSRAREWVLGGASRTVLDSMTVPVLMSH